MSRNTLQATRSDGWAHGWICRQLSLPRKAKPRRISREVAPLKNLHPVANARNHLMAEPGHEIDLKSALPEFLLPPGTVQMR